MVNNKTKNSVSVRLFLFVWVLLSASLHDAFAQSRSLPIIDLPGTPSSMALGGASFVEKDVQSIYSDMPSAYMMDNHHTGVSYSLGVIGSTPSNTFHALSVSHREGSSVIMLGARYLSQGKIHDVIDADMQPTGKSLNMYSYMADIGYGYMLRHLTLYATLGVASEKTAMQINAYRVNLGASYHKMSKNIHWIIGAGVRDLGMMTVNGTSNGVSPLLHGGGMVAFDLGTGQKLDVCVDGGAYLPIGEGRTSETIGGGLGYTFFHNYTIRTGFHAGDGNSYIGAGASCKIGHCKIDAAVKFAYTDNLYNIYMVGLGVDL